jgi:hypothetical protein
MGRDAIIDPTGAEIVAKAIIQQRKNEHLEKN